MDDGSDWYGDWRLFGDGVVVDLVCEVFVWIVIDEDFEWFVFGWVVGFVVYCYLCGLDLWLDVNCKVNIRFFYFIMLRNLELYKCWLVLIKCEDLRDW